MKRFNRSKKHAPLAAIYTLAAGWILPVAAANAQDQQTPAPSPTDKAAPPPSTASTATLDGRIEVIDRQLQDTTHRLELAEKALAAQTPGPAP